MNPRVTIACSGLGRVHRGSEAWAQDLAELLSRHGVPVRLVGAAPLDTRVPYLPVWTVPRDSRVLPGLEPRLRYVAEQALFTRGLVRVLRDHPTEIVHVSDPQVGWWLRERFRRSGPAVFYRDGLNLGPDWLWRFDHVQVLAPQYRDEAAAMGRDVRGWHVIPHFVDVERFHPAGGARTRPHDGPVLLSVGDFAPGSHKRLEYLIDEVARLPAPLSPHLWIAGHTTEPDRVRLEALGRSRLGARFALFPNLPRAAMADLYRRADVLVHGALREPFGMVFLEAMASGLPVVAHDFPVTRWIGGEAGEVRDLSAPGALAQVLGELLPRPGWIDETGLRARDSMLQRFAPGSVLPQYLEAYRRIARDPRPVGGAELPMPSPEPVAGGSPAGGRPGAGDGGGTPAFPRVAIACCGLGKIRRGNEAWAEDLAVALNRTGLRACLMGSGELAPAAPYTRVFALSRQSAALSMFGPRTAYLGEQWLFARGVIRRFRRERDLILHVADPQVGWWLRDRFRSDGPVVFYKDGLQLGPDWLWRFDHVQVLAPYYREQALAAGRDASGWHVIPHFVDPDRFRPDPGRGGRRPGPVLLAVGDMAAGSNKRLDYLVEEVARYQGPSRPHLWIAGHATAADAARMESMGRALLGDRFRLHANLTRPEMPALYASADVYVHGALREPFGICFLEAMASGLPVVAHQFPVTTWIVGDGGLTRDLSVPGGLARALGELLDIPGRVPELGAAARRRVLQHFSPGVVVPLYLRAYREIARSPRPKRA